MPTPHHIFEAALQSGGTELYGSHLPDCIYHNLKPGIDTRRYQQEAFGRFVYYWTKYRNRLKEMPVQLLFHMATGSGKTLIMAGLIVYLYEQGYRNFLFFVNSTNIIEKTRENFLNPASSKYLFAETIEIGNKRIRIKEVENFQAANQEDINIVFSTIQGLHSRLNTPKETSLTYDDFEDRTIVFISDEAHHLNAETKQGKQINHEELFEIVSWERTVNRIFQANRDNLLLEFTATADLNTPEIAQKYQDKILFDYPLKQFRKDGYSKEVNVLQADLAPVERALQGVILSQYRRKIFERHHLHIKPVILFKSKTIKESQAMFEEFTQRIKSLTRADLEKIQQNAFRHEPLHPTVSVSDSGRVLRKAFEYFARHGMTLENLVTELKEDFSETKCLSVNSKDESEQKQIAVNSLEDEANEYRAIFAVDKLNEGWDVLNLFDIVRLYDTRDAKQGVPGKTTMSEAQLIGRGARYCPFQLSPEQPLYCRKFDDDVEHELRICEELYYHSAYNPRYIQELNTALEEIGIKPKETKERHLRVKDTFKATPFYQSGLLFLNERRKYHREDVFGLPSAVIQHAHTVTLNTGYTKSSAVFAPHRDALTLERAQKEYVLSDFGQHLLRKAINTLEFYQFCHLKKYLPNLTSISEFMTSPNYLGAIKVNVSGLPEQVAHLEPAEKLDAAIQVLERIAEVMTSDHIEHKGTKEFKPHLLKERLTDKTRHFTINEGEDGEAGQSMNDPHETAFYLNLSAKDWYVFNDCFGTSEEKQLIMSIEKVYDALKAHYDEIYLMQNETHVKMYHVDDGRAIEPNFLLFLAKYAPAQRLHYQIWIETHGVHLSQADEWNEAFLNALTEQQPGAQRWKGKKYIVCGMSFSHERQATRAFEQYFETLIDEAKDA